MEGCTRAARSRIAYRALALAGGVAGLCALALPASATPAPASAAAAPAGLASSHWQQAALPANYYVGNGQNGPAVTPVSCVPGTQFCLAITSYLPPGLNGQIPQGVVVTKNGGASWHGFASLSSGPYVNAASCATKSACWVAGFNPSTGAPEIAESTDLGKTWSDKTPASIASPSQQLVGLDCVTAKVCWVVGDDQTNGVAPFAAKTTDGGSTWKVFKNLPAITPYDPNGTYQLSTISCTSAASCVAGGGLNYSDGMAQAISTTDGGKTWSLSTSATLAGLQQVFSLSCLPASSGPATCMGAADNQAAAGPVAIRSTDGGATWTALQSFDTTGWLNSVSCADTTHCWAAGAGTTVGLAGTADGGASWSTVTADTSNIEGVVSCASLTLCVASSDNELWVSTDFGGLGGS